MRVTLRTATIATILAAVAAVGVNRPEAPTDKGPVRNCYESTQHAGWDCFLPGDAPFTKMDEYPVWTGYESDIPKEARS